MRPCETLRAVICGGGMAARHFLFPAIAVALFAACGGSGEPSREGTATPVPSASPTAGPGIDLPLPQRVSFAPGEVVSADGPGIFFTDPYTGATEGWHLPDAVNKEMPFEFSVSDVTADGRLLLYECQRHNATGQLAPCGSTDPLEIGRAHV